MHYNPTVQMEHKVKEIYAYAEMLFVVQLYSNTVERADL